MGITARKCVLDTNILIYHLNGVLKEDVEELLENVLELGSTFQ